MARPPHPLEAELLRLLDEPPDGVVVTVKQLMAKTGEAYYNVYQALERLFRKGFIAKRDLPSRMRPGETVPGRIGYRRFLDGECKDQWHFQNWSTNGWYHCPTCDEIRNDHARNEKCPESCREPRFAPADKVETREELVNDPGILLLAVPQGPWLVRTTTSAEDGKVIGIEIEPK